MAAGKGPGGLLEEDPSESLSFVYPFGATLTVQKPAVAVLSSGSVSYPQNRPVCAFYQKVGIWVYCGVPYVQCVRSTRRWAYGCTVVYHMSSMCVLPEGGHMGVLWCTICPVCAFYQKVGIWVYCGVPYVQYVCSTRRWAYGCTVVYHMSSMCVLPEGGHMGVLWCTICPVCAFYQKVGIWVYCGVPYVSEQWW